METIKLIQPAPVVRDENGMFQHPDMPNFDEGDGDKCKAWVAEQGLTVTQVCLEYADEAVADRYFEAGDPDCSYWEPDRPDGEGWFCLAIHDTDDGPVCWWARRDSLAHPLSELRNQAVEEWLEGVVADQGPEAAEKCKNILLKCGYCTQVTP